MKLAYLNHLSFKDVDCSSFQDYVMEVYEDLMNHSIDKDIGVEGTFIKDLMLYWESNNDISNYQSLIRLLIPLIESDECHEIGMDLLKRVLRNESPIIRHTGLEVISDCLDEEKPYYQDLLYMMSELSLSESSKFVREFLETLNG